MIHVYYTAFIQLIEKFITNKTGQYKVIYLQIHILFETLFCIETAFRMAYISLERYRKFSEQTDLIITAIQRLRRRQFARHFTYRSVLIFVESQEVTQVVNFASYFPDIYFVCLTDVSMRENDRRWKFLIYEIIRFIHFCKNDCSV